ncbi:nicotinate-nicotinamide nucleotide adenylyltransferase, partial [Peribacillus simplex]|uniref:nicotinate-nicotinamide nucleotide adenylyltransferase n=2 Tax=Peribacillus TaxID=2675229 RepID=UPI001E313457
MKKIGILGGTFNPPHIGHLIIANEVLDALELDEIRFMPNHVPPHKEKSEEVTDMDRLAMLENAIAGNSSFYIEGIEIERKGTSYTYDTIKLLK